MNPRIGLALSGGGFRATAFGLGCLRALHDRDLLQHVRVVSGISGGSLLTAMWAYGPRNFGEFDRSVEELVRGGLQAELVRRALSPAAVAKNTVSALRAMVSNAPRSHTRTDALVAALTHRPFGARDLREVTHPDLHVVISSTDVITGNAMRFGSTTSSLSSRGKIMDRVQVGEAAAASAAFPVLLPALTRSFTFETLAGTQSEEQVVLTDGGVYDNLGVSPLLPGRSAQHTHHAYDLDFIVAADSGRGRASKRASRFMLGRLSQSFDITHTKSQDAARAKVHDAASTGQLGGLVHVYLGMRDERLPVHLADLVPRERVATYPTNFAAMSSADFQAVTLRGEQLTRILLSAYHPGLR
ncbi:hypothetical protein CH252_33150 [Rhodococcus sp. 06-1477-1B]|nr:hypothetical protein CH252_33150 [Rhodococcus sp. 06-1477-1B]